jgi:hypothetical protein
MVHGLEGFREAFSKEIAKQMWEIWKNFGKLRKKMALEITIH